MAPRPTIISLHGDLASASHSDEDGVPTMTLTLSALRRDTRRLPLRGADLVLMARHRRWSEIGRSNNTLLVVECDGPLDADRVTRSLDRFLDVCPWPAARLRRTFPWGKLHWAAGPRETLTRPSVRRAAVATRGELERALVDELDARIEARREPPVRVVLLDGKPGASSYLVLTWFHPLMDARGGQNFLAHLDHLDRHRDERPWGGAPPLFVSERDPRPFKQRAKIAGGSLAYLKTLAPVPPVSPGSNVVPPGRTCFRRESFVSPDSAAGERATREITWRLALVGKAMAELWARRGLAAVPFLLPISVDLRPKGELGATFGNHLAFHFARFSPSETADVPALARALRRQMADAVRDGQVDASVVALEFLHYRPLSMMLQVLPWTKGGELFSFNCADLADWPPVLRECFGRRVINAYHVPVVPPRPGLGVFFNRCDGRNNLVVSWLEGAVNDTEAARIIEVIRDGMGWTRTS
jgi:hypothetical protein